MGTESLLAKRNTSEPLVFELLHISANQSEKSNSSEILSGDEFESGGGGGASISSWNSKATEYAADMRTFNSRGGSRSSFGISSFRQFFRASVTHSFFLSFFLSVLVVALWSLDAEERYPKRFRKGQRRGRQVPGGSTPAAQCLF